MRLTLSNRSPNNNKQRKKKVLLKKILFKEGIFPGKMIVRVKKERAFEKAKETFNHFRMLFNLTLPPSLLRSQTFFPESRKLHYSINLQLWPTFQIKFSNLSVLPFISFLSFSKFNSLYTYIYIQIKKLIVIEKRKKKESDSLIFKKNIY